MNHLITIMRKEVYHIWRDPRTLALILLLPAMLLILLGYGISGERNRIPLVIADLSRTDASRAYAQKFLSSSDFLWAYSAMSEEEILALLDRNEAEAAILIPREFGKALDSGRTAQVQFYLNGSSDPTDVQTIQLKLNAIHQMAVQDLLTAELSRSPLAAGLSMPIESFTRVLYNPNSDQRWFMIPGLIPIILQVQALLLTALAIVREREQGTMEQLIVTPVKPWELMLGKIIPYLAVGIFNLFVLLVLGYFMFGVSVTGSFWMLAALSVVFIVGSLGLGVLISNLAQSQMQAIYLSVFVILIPAIILSGLLFPRDNMPLVTYLYSMLLPVTHYLEIVRGIMVRGIGAESLWQTAILPLIVLSIGYFVASVLAFRKRI
ncbi:MAG: ABC transporter permease [Anaerolineales bacterium]|nr:ABC transporter permease [Anaerolineales bacterium]